MSFITCQFEKHGQIILEIYNDVIAHSTALYETEPRTIETIKDWFNQKEKENFPVIGYENEDGQLLGFVSYGRFRTQPATHLTLEHSLYIHKNSRGQKVGKKLLKRYLEHITLEGYHTTIAAIDSENIACIELHKKFGFTHQGNIRQIARKFDRWLNLEYYQLILSSSPLSDDFETQNQLTQ